LQLQTGIGDWVVLSGVRGVAFGCVMAPLLSVLGRARAGQMIAENEMGFAMSQNWNGGMSGSLGCGEGWPGGAGRGPLVGTLALDGSDAVYGAAGDG
jgi:hypothetical protein